MVRLPYAVKLPRTKNKGRQCKGRPQYKKKQLVNYPLPSRGISIGDH